MAARSLRIFVALALEHEDRERLAAFAGEALRDQRGLRLVPADNLHVTVVFCGQVPETRVSEVEAAMREELAPALPLTLRSREVRTLGGVVALVQSLTGLEGREDEVAAPLRRRLVRAGLAPDERRPWLPHVTLARAERGRRPPRLQLSAPPGDVSPSGAAVYTTVPMRGGVTYRPLALIGHRSDRCGGGDGAPPRGG
jgi:2'-5' RNA ligase